MSICRRYIRQDEKAREVLNLGFYRILTKIDQYQPLAPFQYWARKVMVSVLINEHKKEKLHYSHHQYVEVYNEEAEFGVINEAIERSDIREIAALIEKLPAASRNVFNLYVVDGYSHAEIASMLGISEGTSKWHLNAARTKLKEFLNEKKTRDLISNETTR